MGVPPFGTRVTQRCCAFNKDDAMAQKAAKKTARGRKQDRARVAGGQDYEVRYEAKKSGNSDPDRWQETNTH
jgi:Protein of unknown function (DUF3606)